MEIIGVLNKNWIVMTCGDCHCVFKANTNELENEANIGQPPYYHCKCPICGSGVSKGVPFYANANRQYLAEQYMEQQNNIKDKPVCNNNGRLCKYSICYEFGDAICPFVLDNIWGFKTGCHPKCPLLNK